MKLFGQTPKEKYHSYKGNIRKMQFSFSWGKCYPSLILDMNINVIISYDLSLNPNREQIQRMLDIAFGKFLSVKEVIFHFDRLAVSARIFKKYSKKHEIIQSVSRKGNCYDNCIMETFFRRHKKEIFYGYEKDYCFFNEFSEAVRKYIDHFNNKSI